MTIQSPTTSEFDMRDHCDFIIAIGATSAYRGTASAATPEPVRIELNHVVVRGGDTLVSVEGDAHVALAMHNGLLALHGFLYDGVRREMTSQGASRLQLDHVTADLGEGAIRIKDISRGAWLRAEMYNSIILGRPENALIEHVGSSASMEPPLEWRGDGNIYSRWSWIFRQQSSDASRNLTTLLDWQDYWNRQSSEADFDSLVDDVQWLGPAADDRPLYLREPANYVLANAKQYSLSSPEGVQPPPGALVTELPGDPTEEVSRSDVQ